MVEVAVKFRTRIREMSWDRYARWYDTLQPRIIRRLHFFGELSFEEFQERVVEAAELREADTVLDVACGTGAAHPAIVRIIGPRGRLVGTDISGNMLKRAKARGSCLQNAEYQRADAEQLSAIFEKESFDAVISINGLPQFPHPDKALLEMVSVLRPGGRLAVSTINRDKCEKNLLLRPLMALTPRLWRKVKFRRRLQRLGLVRLTFAEEGLMLVLSGEKTGGRRRKGISSR